MGQRGGTLYFHLESKNSYLVEPPKDIFSSHDGPIKMAKIAKKKEKKKKLNLVGTLTLLIQILLHKRLKIGMISFLYVNPMLF